jgi:hypothetical protein
MAARKTAAKKKSASSGAKAKVGKVMREFKRGELKSGGKKQVKNPKQAIAIGLSEARRAGADVPPKPAARKRAAAKKTATAKGAAKKAPAKKAARNKTAGR